MKKRKTFIGLALLIAVLILGVGYATLTTKLNINGTATVNEAANGFKVVFSDAQRDTQDVIVDGQVTSTATVTENDTSVATMLASFTNVGETQTATFTVKNISQNGIKAKISKANVGVFKDAEGKTAWSSEYFDINVTTAMDEDTTNIELDNDETTTVTVSVTLNKAYIGTSADIADEKVEEAFYVILSGVEAVQR